MIGIGALMRKENYGLSFSWENTREDSPLKLIEFPQPDIRSAPYLILDLLVSRTVRK